MIDRPRIRPRRLLLLLALVAGCQNSAGGQAPAATGTSAGEEPDVPRVTYGMVIHGGAGTILPEQMTPEREQEFRAKLTEALETGHAVLRDGGSSLDAVEATIRVLEDSPLFNAGRGAVFTADGTNSLDAAIMDGATLQAGAVAGVRDVKNPITLARLVKDRSPHVMLSGAGAEQFAREQGVESTPVSYFRTDHRWQQLQDAKAAERAQPAGADTVTAARRSARADKFGTVGAVALDREGRLAAGTSTGGMTNKKWGRIGDSPLIGAGTYAGARCAVSATGWGEYFIRNVVAYDVCARMEYGNVTLRRAADDVIMRRLEEQEKETGGIIAMDAEGNIVMPFNTPGMYRGWVDAEGRATVEIYR
jgi:beta-aspartyl-peptidase (threonine type)